MKNYFEKIVSAILKDLPDNEVLLINYSGEHSHFVRFNHASIRQPGSVLQQEIQIRLIIGEKHAQTTLPLTTDFELDFELLSTEITTLRQKVPLLTDDPHLLYSTEPTHSETIHAAQPVSNTQMIDDILAATQGLDMVGIFAAGQQAAGFANSLGQFNWFETHNFSFDFSLYHSTDKAVKGAYNGTHWDKNTLAEKIEQMREHLQLLSLPSKTITPGDYRCYLSPAAVHELLTLLNWGGFSYDAATTKTSPFMPVINREITLNEKVNLSDSPQTIGIPTFDAWGFDFQNDVQIIEKGQVKQLLASTRDAKEHNIEANSRYDYGNAITLATGDLSSTDILETLGTGIYISNLWYCNFSDRPRGRITGMTRFASFWVENGKIIAPLNVMRFDDAIGALFGENLIDLDDSADNIADTSTYHARQMGGASVPGMLVKAMKFTL